MASLATPCPHCGAFVAPGRTRCKACDRSILEAPAPRADLTPEAVLQRELQRQVVAGWTVTSQTATTAMLIRRGAANPLITLVLLLCGLLPGILYGVLARPTETLYLVVAPDGTIARTVARS
jgi:hypothetical protein